MSSGIELEVLARIRLVCLDLPEVTEEVAWAGVRWCVARKNFAHVLNIADGWPPAYAKAARTSGPVGVITFRLPKEGCAADRYRRAPFFRPVWFANIAGLIIGATTDWDEVGDLLRASYRVLAPKRLIERMAE